jgi:hypothetical protein
VKKHHANQARRKHKAAVAPVSSNWTPRGPDDPGITVPVSTSSGPLASGASGSGTGSTRSLVSLLLAVALGVALLVTAVATIPQRVHRPALALVYERRETVIFVGLATAGSIALGLMIALLGS